MEYSSGIGADVFFLTRRFAAGVLFALFILCLVAHFTSHLSLSLEERSILVILRVRWVNEFSIVWQEGWWAEGSPKFENTRVSGETAVTVIVDVSFLTEIMRWVILVENIAYRYQKIFLLCNTCNTFISHSSKGMRL